MTCKEFSIKYSIPYHIAYAATYKVKPVSSMLRDRDYPEDELFTATCELIMARMDKHTRLLNQANNAYASMLSARAKEGYTNEMPKVRRESPDL